MDTKKYENLDFTDNFMFSKIMETNPDLCKELLELILDKTIIKIELPEKEKHFDITSDGKSIRLDVYVKDGDGVTIYDLEMQTTSQDDLPQRLRYYQGMIDLSLIEKGASYGELRKSYIIFICTFDPFERGLCCYRFENFCCDNKALPLNDGAVKIILNSRGYIKNVSVELQGFLEYVDTKQAKTDLTRKIDDQVQSAKKHEEWRREYMTLLMRDNENQKIGANRLRKLLQLLASKGLTDERERAIDDSEYAEILYRKYNIQ